MANNRFALTPTCNISRTKMSIKWQHKTSFNLGEIVPIYTNCDIIPGSTYSIDLASLIRMSTPIAPIMDNIYLDVFAFFVPHRLSFNKWVNVCGENDSTYWTASEVDVPVMSSTNTIKEYSIGRYMGLPYGCQQKGINVLAGRSYIRIWNEWFRDQNVQAPIALAQGAESYISSELDYTSYLLKANKYHDLFTSCLPGTQKGDAVTIPLGIAAPVQIVNNGSGTIGVNSNVVTKSALAPGQSGNIGPAGDTTLYADLTNATAATINQLRYAFQTQKLLEKDALYGTRYFELLQAHFGTTNPDARLQRSEYLGGKKFRINVDQVLQTTGYSAGQGTSLGTPGANSVTADNSSIFTKSFSEHGTLMILAVARQDRSYGQGIPKMFTKTKRFHYYYPVLANIGNVPVMKTELYYGANANDVFGYQEAWYEYRYEGAGNRVSGMLDPNVPNSLDFWTLAEKFSSAPSLSASFIEESRGNLSRALATGSDGPDFIADFYVHGTKVLPMPLYSIPGLIDHH